MLRAALLQVTSNEDPLALAKWKRMWDPSCTPRSIYWSNNGCTESGHLAQVQMMRIELWLKSCNACETREVQSYKKKLKKQSSLSQDFRESKKGPKHNILRKHRQNELATAGETGGVLWAAYHVVWNLGRSSILIESHCGYPSFVMWDSKHLMRSSSPIPFLINNASNGRNKNSSSMHNCSLTFTMDNGRLTLQQWPH